MTIAGPVHVVGPDGKARPAQMEAGKVLFAAKSPSVGYAVYDVAPGAAANPREDLAVTASSLENARYRVHLNADGDVSSIFDKQLNQELLSAPVRLAISNERPRYIPPGTWSMSRSRPRRGLTSAVRRRFVSKNGPGACFHRGDTRDGRIKVRPDHQSGCRRCGRSRRVREFDRLADAWRQI